MGPTPQAREAALGTFENFPSAVKGTWMRVGVSRRPTTALGLQNPCHRPSSEGSSCQSIQSNLSAATCMAYVRWQLATSCPSHSHPPLYSSHHSARQSQGQPAIYA